MGTEFKLNVRESGNRGNPLKGWTERIRKEKEGSPKFRSIKKKKVRADGNLSSGKKKKKVRPS